MTDEKKVAGLFDRMADEYDRLEDEWYPHLFRQLERVLRAHPPQIPGEPALDVGCGTGLQTLLLQSMGYRATGVDISEGLLAEARRKAQARNLSATFLTASATHLPFEERSFRLVTCCGSVLGFVPDYARALAEMARVIEPGGKLILEVDHRWNLDLAWALFDHALFGKLGFEQSLRSSLHNLLHRPSRGIQQEYPFTKLDGSTETMSVRLFTRGEVIDACRKAGLEPRETYAVHAVTNLLPSTWLAHPHLSPPLRALARVLVSVDEKVASRLPFRKLANNLIMILERR